jgi:hypothetical protein
VITTRLRSGWALVAAAVPVALVLGLAPAQASAASFSAGGPTSAWPAGVPRPPAPDCAEQGGGRPLIPSSAERLRGGGYAYDFMIDGVDNQYLVPPPSFRPMTASPAQLAEYGFPSAPAAGPARSQWMAAMTSYSGVPAPTLCEGTQRVGDARPSASTPLCKRKGITCLANWAGFNTKASTNRWIGAQGAWVQSKAKNCHCKGPTEEVSWAGIGGRYSASLLQAGTEMAGSSIFAWYEYLRTCATGECGPNIITVGKVKALSDIFTETSYETSSRTANFFVEAAGHVYPIKPKKLSKAYYNGQSAEWIDERPSHCQGDCYEALTNFVFNDWSKANAENTGGHWQSVQSQTHFEDVMWDGRQALVKPSRLHGATFRDTWQHAS